MIASELAHRGSLCFKLITWLKILPKNRMLKGLEAVTKKAEMKSLNHFFEDEFCCLNKSNGFI